MKDRLQMFKALADMTRLRILRILNVKPLCVCEVMVVLGMAQSTTSQHLRILENSGFIDPIQGGTWTIYRLSPRSDVAGRLLKIVLEAEPTTESKGDLKAAKTVDRNRLNNCSFGKSGATPNRRCTQKG